MEMTTETREAMKAKLIEVRVAEAKAWDAFKAESEELKKRTDEWTLSKPSSAKSDELRDAWHAIYSQQQALEATLK